MRGLRSNKRLLLTRKSRSVRTSCLSSWVPRSRNAIRYVALALVVRAEPG